MNERIALNPNQLVQHLDKPAEDFTKKDIIKFIEDKGIKMLNFRYIGGDGRLKTLNFVINNKKHLDHILSTGERVDGSNLFSYIDAASSDLYVVPRYKTAFINPFTEVPTVDIMCSYYTREGKPLESSPENIIKKAQKMLKEKTVFTFEALGRVGVLSSVRTGSHIPYYRAKRVSMNPILFLNGERFGGKPCS